MAPRLSRRRCYAPDRVTRLAGPRRLTSAKMQKPGCRAGRPVEAPRLLHARPARVGLGLIHHDAMIEVAHPERDIVYKL